MVAPLAVLLVGRRSWRAACAALAGALAVWTVLLIAYAGALDELWESVVADHRDARDLGPSVADNIDRVLLHPLDWRTPAGVLVPIGLVAAVVLLRRLELLALGAWIVVSALFLVAQQPLLDHHFVLLAATLAVPAGAGLGAAVTRISVPARYAIAGAAAIAIAVGFAQEERRLWRQDGDPPGVAPGQPNSYVSGRSRTSSWAPTFPSSPTSPTDACRDSSSTRRSFALAPDR